MWCNVFILIAVLVGGGGGVVLEEEGEGGVAEEGGDQPLLWKSWMQNWMLTTSRSVCVSIHAVWYFEPFPF